MKGSAGNVSIHLKEIDILKALLIICIVIGHCITIPYINVFWFHVPAFFILAGYFISEPETNPLINKKEWTKKIMRYVVPYFAYSISFYLIFRQEPVVKNLVRMFMRGIIILVCIVILFGLLMLYLFPTSYFYVCSIGLKALKIRKLRL